jgi:hypothetical protein
MAKLEQWMVSTIGGPYEAPELHKTVLFGEVHGHKRFSAGKRVRTSEVLYLNTKERKAVTRSGTAYELGEVNTEWRLWLDEEGHELSNYDFDKRN